MLLKLKIVLGVLFVTVQTWLNAQAFEQSTAVML